NKRSLKKGIKYVIGDIAGECLFTEQVLENIDAVKVSEIILKLAELQEDALQKVSVSYEKAPKTFDGTVKEYNKAKCAYYKKCYSTLMAEFNEGIKDVIKDMNALIPAVQKEANKKALAK
ncbi:MAG: hypothetical protein RR854_07670, partial [Muribaculaceae bacterium]